MSKKERYSTLLKDTVLFGISDFASKVLTFFLLPLYTAVFSTEEYGQIDLLSNIVNLIYPLITFSIVEALIRFALDKNKNKNEVLSIAIVFVMGGTVFLAFLSPFSSYFGETFDKYWVMFIMLFNGYSLRMLFSYYCRGCKLKNIFAVQGVLQTVCVIGLNLLFLLIFKFGIVGYLLATICSYYIATIYMIIAGKLWRDIIQFKFDVQLLKEMLCFSIPMIPTQVSWWLANSMDKYFIIAMVGIGASGVFAMAHKIPTILSAITQIFNKAWQISAVSIFESKKSGEEYTEIYSVYCFLCMIVAFGINVFAKLIGIILFDNEFFSAWTYVPVLVIAATLSSMAGFLAQIFTAAKKTKVLFVSTFLATIINFIFNYVLIKMLGTIGAAYATMLCFFFVWLFRSICVRKIVDLKINYIRLFVSLLILIIHAIIIVQDTEYSVWFSLLFIIMFMANNWNYVKKTLIICRTLKNKISKNRY